MVKKIMDESNKGFMKHLGGLELKKISETQYEFTVEVKEIHLNTGKIAHGGFLSTIADTGMGTAAHRIAGDKRCVTINLDMKFISVGQLGDKLVGKVKILKKTKTLVFIFFGGSSFFYHTTLYPIYKIFQVPDAEATISLLLEISQLINTSVLVFFNIFTFPTSLSSS